MRIKAGTSLPPLLHSMHASWSPDRPKCQPRGRRSQKSPITLPQHLHAMPCSQPTRPSLGSKAAGLYPSLPLPGASACEHSPPSAHWGPAAAGRLCCLSELWSVGQTSPNLKQTEKHKDKVSHTLRERRHSHPPTPQENNRDLWSTNEPILHICRQARPVDQK